MSEYKYEGGVPQGRPFSLLGLRGEGNRSFSSLRKNNMQDEDNQDVTPEESTPDAMPASEPAPQTDVAAAHAADDSLLVQNLTLVAFAVLAMSHIAPNLFG